MHYYLNIELNYIPILFTSPDIVLNILRYAY
jgi:hypothetical protein